MTSLLFSIILAALLSATSLIAVLLRVSPLLSPGQAIPAFFLSLLLTVSTVAALLLALIWKYTPGQNWDAGKLLSVSLRQGVFVGLITVILLLLHLINILTWWVGIMVFLVFFLTELALHS